MLRFSEESNGKYKNLNFVQKSLCKMLLEIKILLTFVNHEAFKRLFKLNFDFDVISSENYEEKIFCWIGTRRTQK